MIRKELESVLGAFGGLDGIFWGPVGLLRGPGRVLGVPRGRGRHLQVVRDGLLPVRGDSLPLEISLKWHLVAEVEIVL